MTLAIKSSPRNVELAEGAILIERVRSFSAKFLAELGHNVAHAATSIEHRFPAHAVRPVEASDREPRHFPPPSGTGGGEQIIITHVVKTDLLPGRQCGGVVLT
ncbi:hypothetical protein ACULNC_08365 [Shigella flexneri]